MYNCKYVYDLDELYWHYFQTYLWLNILIRFDTSVYICGLYFVLVGQK